MTEEEKRRSDKIFNQMKRRGEEVYRDEYGHVYSERLVIDGHKMIRDRIYHD